MPNCLDQFKFQKLNDHFEHDPHQEVQGLSIANIRVLHGETADDDILVVEDAGSPAHSFFNSGVG